MNSHDLTKEQLQALRRAVCPTRHYLRKLKARMSATQFPNDDRLQRNASAAEMALDTLVKNLDELIAETRYRRKPVPEEELDPRKIF